MSDDEPHDLAHDAARVAAEVAQGAADTARRNWGKIVLVTVLAVVLTIGGLLAAMRYGVLLPQARLLIQAATNGLRVGRFGRLHIEGLKGDIWTDLSVARLTLSDEKGVWLEADDLHLKWRYLELLRRNFQADAITVGDLKLVRRPSLSAAGGEEQGLPLSFHIAHGRGRLELMPAFSYEHGVYDLDFNLDLARKGGVRTRLRARSVLRPGDHLFVDYDVRPKRPLVIQVDAMEAKGGALAGAVGLPATRPFILRVAAGGRASQGRFTALALSGEARPLEAQGAWTKQSGQASGHLDLTASSLTRSLADRLGPEARFQISGRRAGPDLFALEAQARAENLTLTASGLGDLGKRRIGPRGLQVVVETGRLSRITGGPQVGPARISGVLTQAPTGLDFQGRAAVTDAALGAYGLARASGPVTLSYTRGELAAELQLAGAGGRGKGFIAAALGGAPRASLAAARLADGRLELRRLEVAGAGLKLSATGGRSLLGGLSFKGQARLGNLAAAHLGAGGSASASWSASQARAGQPWALSLDARGEKFATGYPELDRLLGARPQFQARANLDGRKVSVGSASLKGAALSATSAGVLAPNGALSFKIDWSAQGPFHAGPVEIAGKARGSGALTGTLGAPKVDLLAHLDSIAAPRLTLTRADVTLTFQQRPDGANGVISVAAASAYGPARGRAAFRFPQGGLDLTDLTVDAGGVKAAGSLSLRHNAPSAADLDLAVTRGAFLDAGRVAGHVKIAQAATARASLDLSADGVRLPGSAVVITAGRLAAQGTMDRLPYTLTASGRSAQGAWAARGRGVFAQSKPGYSATFDGSGQLGGRSFHTAEPAVFRLGGGERSARLRLAASDGGRLDLDGRLTDDAADIHATVSGLGLDMLDEDLTGKFDATLDVSGRGKSLEGALQAKLAGARGRGAPAASGVAADVQGRLAGGALTLTATAANAQGLKANAAVTLPALATAAPFHIAIATREPLHGRFFASGEVRPLWDLLVGGDRSLSGRVQTEGVLSGTLAQPRASGHIAVDDGRFDDGQTGLSLRRVSLRAGFSESEVNVTQATGVDGHGGSVSGAGRISLEPNGASSFKLNLTDFRLIDNERATASASGQTTIDRTADGKVRLAGDLLINQAQIAAKLPTPSGVVTMAVIEKNRPADLPQVVRTTGPSGGTNWALDVGLHAPSHIMLRGRGLDVELSLDAHVGGTVADPQLSGTARVVRGDYDFAGKRFEFDPESVVYLSTEPDQIRLELLATREDPSLTAHVSIRGTAAKPEITLTSTPSLPSDEVLSQVLFGQSASQLTGAQAAELASALSSLAGGGGLDVIGNLRAFAGLDRLALGSGVGGGVTLAGGKYLTDNVYLEIAGGGREGPTAQVEWRVQRNLSIISKVAGQGGGSLAIRWRKDY